MKLTPITIQKGADFEHQFRVKFDKEDYNALSLDTIKGVLWVEGAEAITIEFTIPAVVPESNELSIKLTAAQTLTLQAPRYEYMVYNTTPENIRYWIARGPADTETGPPVWP